MTGFFCYLEKSDLSSVNIYSGVYTRQGTLYKVPEKQTMYNWSPCIEMKSYISGQSKRDHHILLLSTGYNGLTQRVHTELADRYSVMQSDGNFLCGDFVLDSFNKAYSDEDSILDKRIKNKHFRIFTMKILEIKSDGRKCIF